MTRRGVVAAVHTHLTATPIPAGGMVIVAQGSARDRLRQAGIRGLVRVSVSTRAQSAVPGGLYSAIGVGEVLIRDGIDGNLACGADTLQARTLVGIKPGGQGLFVVTAQGQTPDKPADLDTPDGPNRKVLQDGVQADRKRPADPEQLRFLASLSCSPVRV